MTFNDWMNQMLRNFIDKVEEGQYNKEDAQDWLAQNNLPKFPIEEEDEDQTGF
jgi:hypothetical protein